jgi:hypothetical protein
VAVAGQFDEQRPHSVQLNMSSTCFQVNWSMCEVPNVAAFSRSCFESCPIGSSFRKKTFGSDVMMWKCLESGRRFRKTSTTRLWSHHATSRVQRAPVLPDGGVDRRADEPRERLPARLVRDTRDRAPARRHPAAVVDEAGDHDRPDEAEDDVRLPVRLLAHPVLRRAGTRRAASDA